MRNVVGVLAILALIALLILVVFVVRHDNPKPPVPGSNLVEPDTQESLDNLYNSRDAALNATH